MSSLPNEIFSDITNFLPNDDITDLMLLSKTFNALLTPRLKKIDQAKKRMKEVFENEEQSIVDNGTFEVIENRIVVNCMTCDDSHMLKTFDILKEGMSLERFDDTTFLRILGALVAMPKFRQEYNISFKLARHYILHITIFELLNGPGYVDDVLRIWENVLRTEEKQIF
ncbi:hypothetical protein Ddc_17635 [Ditylenchus destructor]|nr:hypothetical protein Ddc_17635 [Ditylenchus destructor]